MHVVRTDVPLIVSIDVKRLQKVEEEIKSQGGEVLSVAGDVGADDFPKVIVDATIEYGVSNAHHHHHPSNFI
jgi:3-oxoacyl-[acyl-carrier protein] reductase